jgi:hypothetical protein
MRENLFLFGAHKRYEVVDGASSLDFGKLLNGGLGINWNGINWNGINRNARLKHIV